MSPNEILNQILDGKRPKQRDVAGLGKEFFLAVIEHYGSDHAAMMQVARHWRTVLKFAEDASWVHRAGGIALRETGAWMKAAEQFLLAGTTSSDPVQRYSFQLGAIDCLAQAGRIDEATRLANRIHRALTKQGEHTQAARACLNLGNALTYVDQTPQAVKWFRLAIPALQEAGLVSEQISAQLGLSSALLFGGQVAEALRLAEEARARATEEELDHLAKLAEINLAHCYLLSQRPEHAHELLVAILPWFSESPVDRCRVEEYLAEAKLRLNLYSEALVLASDLLRNQQPKAGLQRANLWMIEAEANRELGNTELARKQFRLAAKEYGSFQNDPWHAIALANLSRCETPQRAKATLQAAVPLTQASPYALALVHLELARYDGTHLQTAKSLVQRYGFRRLEWMIHARSADGAANPERALAKMVNTLLEDRVNYESYVGRYHFLRDKQAEIEKYLALLLSKPTKARVEKAVSVVTQIRSATLADRLLASDQLSQDQRAWLGELIASDETPEPPRDGTRKTTRRAAIQVSVSRWHTLVKVLPTELRSQSRNNDCTVLVQCENDLFGVRGSSATKIQVQISRLRDQIRWMFFELFAPQVDPNTPTRTIECQVKRLMSAFEQALSTSMICPDGVGWSIPWSLLAAYRDPQRPVAIALHPLLPELATISLTKNSRALIWFAEAPDLTHAQQELEIVRSIFPNHVIAISRESALQSLQDEYDLVHVIAHATHRPENPSFSSIEFADGSVFVHEITGSGLRTQFAMLAACDTGSVGVGVPQEPDGLARAFVSRGAKAAVGSQWALSDQISPVLVQSYYEKLLQSSDPLASLTHCQQVGRQFNPHPYYWAPFTVYAGMTE